MPRAGSSTHEGRATLLVRRCAGEILLELLRGPRTTHELVALGYCKRTVGRAVSEIELWGDIIETKQVTRKGVRGCKPFVYSLKFGWRQTIHDVLPSLSLREGMMVSLGLALEGAA